MANIVFDGVLDVRVIASGDAALRAIAASDRALKLAMAAQAVGGAEQVFSLARDYACTREQFGQPIGAFQAIAHMLADGAVNIAGASMLVHRAAAALDGSAAGGEASPDCWIDMAKLKACQVFRDVSAMAIQVHGGIGFTLEAAPQLYFRRAKHLQLMHGEPLDLMTTIGATVLAGDHRMLDSNG
jgi:alkylation response protein AidB-like acyl-CoA dehydrogenase